MKFKTLFKYLKNLAPIILSMYLLLFGLSWVFLHIYMRIFMERPSYNLLGIKPFLTLKHYTFFAGFILLHIIIIVLALIAIYRQMFPRAHASIFAHLAEKVTLVLNVIYWKPLEYIYDLIAPNIPVLGSFFLYLEKIWSLKDPIYFYVLIFLCEILPKATIALVFLIEVIFFGNIKVFLYSISLILITIMWHIFLKLFASFGKRNLAIIKEYFLTIKGVGSPTLDDHGVPVFYPSYEFIVKPEYEDVINTEEEARLLMQLESIQRIAEQLRKDTANWLPYITLVTSLIYVIGGTYRLAFLIL